ncbi:hypothetical protein NG791_07610 [Laspinema sp. D1]|uniref:hypothetical protein n=1 Tax=Laspinema palackyanum TaxID=3231601 RepID=UPI0034758569|nr:hypothetical protein [Laspinema sp. D2b]
MKRTPGFNAYSHGRSQLSDRLEQPYPLLPPPASRNKIPALPNGTLIFSNREKMWYNPVV